MGKAPNFEIQKQTKTGEQSDSRCPRMISLKRFKAILLMCLRGGHSKQYMGHTEHQKNPQNFSISAPFQENKNNRKAIML